MPTYELPWHWTPEHTPGSNTHIYTHEQRSCLRGRAESGCTPVWPSLPPTPQLCPIFLLGLMNLQVMHYQSKQRILQVKCRGHFEDVNKRQMVRAPGSLLPSFLPPGLGLASRLRPRPSHGHPELPRNPSPPPPPGPAQAPLTAPGWTRGPPSGTETGRTAAPASSPCQPQT